MHPTSLPGRFGIGELGAEAYRFVDFLAATGQSYWQVLPLSPTGYGSSPYQSPSAFGGSPMLISLDKLVEDGHLQQDDIEQVPDFPEEQVDYEPVTAFKTELLERAYARFTERGSKDQLYDFEQFCEEQAKWLDDLALFLSLQEAFGPGEWQGWEPGLANRQPEDLARWKDSLADRIDSYRYQQWQFSRQWMDVKLYANQNGVRIIGDIPIFVAMDSADVWAAPYLFHFDDDLSPTVVSGVPPDYFSETGQLWGHPLYRWDVMAEDGYDWWVARFRMAFTQADVVRIDHFRGFYNYWEIPAGEATAVNGEWVNGPGAQLFQAVVANLGDLPIIAEDLGDMDDESLAGVAAIKEEFRYPGMKVLQFAFGDGPDGDFLPHNFNRDCVVYTGTHDNDTTRGWYEVSSTEEERDYARRYLGSDGSDISWDLIRLACSSPAHTAIVPVQDLLDLGHEHRMNMPGTVGPPNWCWRLKSGALGEGIAGRLLELTSVYGRKPSTRDHT
jgi:4-alpha-glucanotransferase